MANILYIFERDKSRDDPTLENRIRLICESLVPNNLHSAPVKTYLGEGISYGIAGSADALLEHQASVLLGQLYDSKNNWWQISSPPPDGSYALFRSSNNTLELLSDVVGTRTIWYYKDDSIFIASSSQRAIVSFLGSFEFNESVIPWVLSSGSLGPTDSWDKRIQRLPPDSQLMLDREHWKVELKSNPIVFEPDSAPKEVHEIRLQEALESTFESIEVANQKWVLPLSGGYDSRGILCLLKNSELATNRMRAITWGSASAISHRDNDAYIAALLADKMGIEHQYMLTNESDEPIRAIFERFILAIEGRNDVVSAYADGMNLWKALHEIGVEGVVRGDEGFGWTKVSSPLSVRQSVGLNLCADYSNLKEYEALGIPAQTIPDELLQKDDESLETFRDRLYHQYRIPTVLAALSDAKLCYVEQSTPLLSRRILEVVRQLPDKLRTEKMLFKRIVNRMSPKIPYAKSGANQSYANILKQLHVVDCIKKELSSLHAKMLFSKELLEYVLGNMQVDDAIETRRSYRLKRTVKKYTPKFLKNAIRDKVAIPLDVNILAFRIYIICRMFDNLMTDANRDSVTNATSKNYEILHYRLATSPFPKIAGNSSSSTSSARPAAASSRPET